MPQASSTQTAPHDPAEWASFPYRSGGVHRRAVVREIRAGCWQFHDGDHTVFRSALYNEAMDAFFRFQRARL